MSDLTLTVTALLVVVAAVAGPPVPNVAVLLVATVALLLRRPVTVALLLVLLVGVRSHSSAAALDEPLPPRISGTAELVSDPTPGDFGTTVELRLHGRRWLARVSRSDEWVLRPLMTGEHVVVTGRPRPFGSAPEGWRRSRHLAGRLSVSEMRPGPRAPPWYRAANRVHRILDAGAASFPSATKALYLGLVIGDDRDQSDLDRFRFQATGLGHLLAVSGQNVAFLLAVARPLLIRCSLRTRWILGLAVLAGFVLVTRAEASVLRAGAMAAVALLAATSGRVVSGGRVLALAVIGLLVVDPLLALGLGFQLSVCATVGLLVGVRPISARLRGPRWVTEALATTIAAQVATAPLLVGLNGGVPLVATPANVAAVPVAGLVMMLGLTVGLVAGVVVEPVAAVLNAPTRWLVRWIGLVAEVGSRSPLPFLGPDRLVLVVAVGGVLLFRPAGRRWPLLLAAALSVPVVAPVTPPVGRTYVDRGVELRVDRCGTRTVLLTGRIDVSDALRALQRHGVVKVDSVTARQDSASAAIAGQLGAPVVPPGTPGETCTVAS